MSKIAEFLIYLQELDIEVGINEDKLKVSAPKGVMTAALKEQISQHKEALLAFLQAAQSSQSAAVTHIQQTEAGPTHPLSLGQERLWQLTQLASDAAVYNIPYSFRLTGPLNTEVLDTCWQQIAHRHEILRTVFTAAEEQINQFVSAEPRLSLAQIDLRDLDGSAQEEQLQTKLGQLIALPFDLTTGPLWRVVLFCLSENEHVLLAVFHHIIFDDWSADVLWRELSLLYNSQLAQKTAVLPVLPIQYGDYARWQHHQLNEGSLKTQLHYWATQLAGKLEPLALPIDAVQAEGARNAGAAYKFEFSPEVTERLKQIGHETHASPFSTLLTSLYLLLQRTTGQTDLLICSPIAGRQSGETESLIGYFNNIVILRNQFTEEQLLREAIQQVQKTVLQAYDHQSAPFHLVAADIRIPLTRAFFTLTDTAAETITLDHVSSQALDVPEETADFDIAIYMTEQKQQFKGTIWYKTALFTPHTIQQLVSNWQQLAQAMTRQPSQKIAALPDFSAHYRPLHKPQTAAALTTAENEIELQLVKLWEELLGIQPISVTDNFFDLGGHSMLAVRLFAQIKEQITGQQLPLMTLLHAPTIRELAAVLEGEGFTSTWKSLVPIQPNGTRPPLFFIHAHGGNVLNYYGIAKYLHPDQPFYGLQAVGLSGQEPFLTSFDEMAAAYIAEMRSVQPHGPYALGGWCMGGYLAYAMAQQLHKQGERVAYLVMLESAHPDYEEPLLSQSRFTRLANNVRERIDLELGRAHGSQQVTKLAYWANRTRQAMNTLQVDLIKRSGRESANSYMNQIAELELANERAFEAYHWQPYNGDVTIVRAGKQPRGVKADEALGWRPLIQGHLQALEIPDIYPPMMLEEPFVEQTSQLITAGLASANFGR